MIRELSTSEDLSSYKTWINDHPQNNLWQSLERKQYLEAIGKTVRIFVIDDGGIVASAMVMIDRTSFGLSTWDIVRGPLWKKGCDDAVEKLIEYITKEAKKDKCLALYYSPIQKIQSTEYRVQSSNRMIQCEATRIIDLTKSEEGILAQMHSKGRYNIKVAKKHGVTVEKSDDIDAYFSLAQKTGKRDKFTIQTKEKYQKFLNNMPGAFLLLAYVKSAKCKVQSAELIEEDKEAKESEEVDEKSTTCNLQPATSNSIKNSKLKIKNSSEAIAGLLGVFYGNQAVYYYGASNYSDRAFMAPYLLQWETILYAKEKGYTSYDLLGIAPLNSEDDHIWKGITSFKEKFGGDVVTYEKEQMILLKPVFNKLIELKRRFLNSFCVTFLSPHN